MVWFRLFVTIRFPYHGVCFQKYKPHISFPFQPMKKCVNHADMSGSILPEMCSERDSPLERLYRRTHAKLTRLASGQLVWAAGCEPSLALGGLCDRARHPRQYFGWPRRAKRGRPTTHEWIDMDASASGSAQWAQVGATDEPREFRLAGSRQDKRLERAIHYTSLILLYKAAKSELSFIQFPVENGSAITRILVLSSNNRSNYHDQWRPIPLMACRELNELTIICPVIYTHRFVLLCLTIYRKISNISRTLTGNKIVDHSDVVGASPVGAAPTTSSFSS